MEPTLRAGDRLLVDYRQLPRIGAMAVVRLPKRPLSVKRLARRVGDDWWVESDNPAMGTDSRVVGVVAGQDVMAVVVCRVWPWRWPARKQ
jgi:Peptidase S24-like